MCIRDRDRVLHLFQFVGNVPFVVCQRLFSDVCRRDEIQIRFRHLKIIAEHLVIANLQVFYARRLAFPGLQLCEPRFSVYGSQAALIYLGMISLFKDVYKRQVV